MFVILCLPVRRAVLRAGGEPPGCFEPGQPLVLPVGPASDPVGFQRDVVADVEIGGVQEAAARRPCTRQRLYGPSAQQETYLDTRYPGSVVGIVTRSRACPGGLGTAYFKVTPPKGADGKPASLDGPKREALNELLASFAAASGARHDCSTT